MPASETPPRIPPPEQCPVCGSTEINATVETNYGAYWRCRRCRHVWHHDTQPRPKLPPFFERYWTVLPIPLRTCA
jgi:RNA polymerase subunit RPABC4/transcription elongation factor Spt4